nr:MAG TPA: hypothetical protein [Caudoviricetes sp.]
METHSLSGFLHKQNPKLCRVWGFSFKPKCSRSK